MPKFDTTKEFFDSLLRQKLPVAELEKILVYAKAELDKYDESTDEITLELNDTNRPDLWSAAGLARQLRSVLGAETNSGYDFFSDPKRTQTNDDRVIYVDSDMRDIRPFIVGFEAAGQPVTDSVLKEIIHTQERLVWNYGRKRKSIAMGIYPTRAIRYPLHYRPGDPQTTKFTPLGMERPLSLAKILETHPKGQQFGALLRDFDRYPCIFDDRGVILSMPPIINSVEAGEVAVGDDHLFIELTGDNLEHLHTANNIVACDLRDMGFAIKSVTVRYDSDGNGEGYTTPYNFHIPHRARIAQIHKLLGVELSAQQITDSISRLGLACRIADDAVEVTPPPWRNDYLHEVDIIEDVMIGMGMEHFTPLPVSDFTVGQLLPIEQLSRQIVRIMIGMGFQEMIHNYLVADEDFIHKMYPRDRWAEIENVSIRIANPRSERHNMVRGSIIPSLLASCAVSAQAPLPHRIFEIGKTITKNADANYGSVTEQAIGIVYSAVDAGFSSINEQLSAIMYYMNIPYGIQESEDPRFIAGRCATIHHDGAVIGTMGELHPQVLENWHIQVPTTACEMDITSLLLSTKQEI